MQQVISGFLHGTGAAINVELGFIPDFVTLINITDGTKIAMIPLNKVIAFTSGGTGEIKAGDTIKGLTNTTVSAKIKQVILDSGTWAGGDAAGWFIFDAEDMVGTFGSENAEVNDSGNNDVAVAAQTEAGVDIDTEVAAASGNTGVQSYVGDADSGYAKGITIGSTLSVNAKLFYLVAVRGAFSPTLKVAGVSQAGGIW